MMKYIRLIIPCIVLASVFVACSSADKRLEYALSFAGDNRGELEKVLEHYGQEPEKLEAARFLIRNMPHWYAYEGWQLDSVRQMLALRKLDKESIKKWKQVSFYSLPKVYDAQVITSNYLIENIDLAFKVWKKYPWNRSLDFDDFCEFILPYRIDNEPLSSWRKLYYEHYTPILDSLYHGEDVVYACRMVCGELKKRELYYFTELIIPHMDGEFLYHHRIGYCRESCDITLYAMRACGIPVATEFFRYSPEYQHYHTWNTLRDTTGRFILFEPGKIDPTRDKITTDNRKKGKAYRYCFGEQKSTALLLNVKDIGIPKFFRNSYIRDVTANYFGENEVTIPIQKEERYIYLGVFRPNGWIPVDMAISNGDKVTFHNLEPNIIYQTLIFDGKQLHPAGYSFIFRNGKAELLEPDRINREEAVLKRKMSIKPTISEWLYRSTRGARIEAANDTTFRQADLLYQIKDSFTTNYYEFCPLHSHQKYKYIRYVPPVGTRVELAELALYEDTLGKAKISMHAMTSLKPIDKIGNITDGNILTYFQATDMTSAITFKLEKESSISRITFSPRNDDNYISPGDVYELFYQDGVSGWQSLGIQTAVTREVRYIVPKNALLWLRNLTKGREEQIFIYRDKKQYFTIDITTDSFNRNKINE